MIDRLGRFGVIAGLFGNTKGIFGDFKIKGVKIIGTGKTDNAFNRASVCACFTGILFIKSDHHHIIGARRMAGHEYGFWVATIIRDIIFRPFQGAGDIIDEVRIDNFRHETIIWQDSHIAHGGEIIADKGVMFFVTIGPRAAIDEDDDRGIFCTGFGYIDIKFLTLIITKGDILSAAHGAGVIADNKV